MNTQQSTAQHLLDEDWIVVINEQLELFPNSIGLVVEPEVLGRYHAQTGAPCEPQKYYRKLGDIELYQWAYNDTTALWASIVQAKNDELAADTFDYEGALQELIDGMEDQEFWRRGC